MSPRQGSGPAAEPPDPSRLRPHVVLAQENTQIRDLQQENRGERGRGRCWGTGRILVGDVPRGPGGCWAVGLLGCVPNPRDVGVVPAGMRARWSRREGLVEESRDAAVSAVAESLDAPVGRGSRSLLGRGDPGSPTVVPGAGSDGAAPVPPAAGTQRAGTQGLLLRLPIVAVTCCALQSCGSHWRSTRTR